MEIKLTDKQKYYFQLIGNIIMIQFFILAISSFIIKYLFDEYEDDVIVRMLKVSVQFNIQFIGLIVQLLIKYIKLHINSIIKDIKIENKNLDLRVPEILH